MVNFDEIIDRKKSYCAKWDSQPEEINDDRLIPLWVADMDFKVAQPIEKAIEKCVKHGIYGYATIPENYDDAIISWMERRHQFKVDKDWIVLTPGVVTALKIAVQAYSQVDDAVLVFKPVYHPFDFSIELNKRKLVECPLVRKENHYEIDLEDLETKIKENDVKLMILCNPDNPVGKVYTQEELYQIGMICKKYQVKVIVDEIHQDFVFGDHEHVPFYNVDESFKDFSIICTAPSKTFNLAGLQTSNIIIANENMRKQFIEVKEANGINDPQLFGMVACMSAYNECELWVDEMLEYINDNFIYLDQFLKTNMPEIKMMDHEGLYLAWIDFTAMNMTHQELEEFMLHKAHLWLDEGYIFGTGGAGFERFNLALPRSQLEKVCQQLLIAYKEKSR